MYYNYSAAVPTATTFTLTANGDLDADGTAVSYTMDQTGALTPPASGF